MRPFQPPPRAHYCIRPASVQHVRQHSLLGVNIPAPSFPTFVFGPGNISSQTKSSSLFPKYQNQNLYLDSYLAAAPFPILLSSPPPPSSSGQDLKYFRCHLSAELNAICHFWKPLGMLLMTGKCFLEIQPHVSAPG